MSDDPCRLTTDEQRERLELARKYGILCGNCGRPLGAGEPVFWERFFIRAHRLRLPDARTYDVRVWGPVGFECASRAFLQQAVGREPERCRACGRGVYYRSGSARRRHALCSKRCADRTYYANRSMKTRAER